MADLDFLKTVDNLTSERRCLRLALRRIVRVLCGPAEAVHQSYQKYNAAKKVVEDRQRRKEEGAVVRGRKKCLDKACKRFKAGSMQRWEQIADYINTQLGLSVPRTRQECIEQFQKPLVDPKQHAERVIRQGAAAARGWVERRPTEQLEKALGTSRVDGEERAVVFHANAVAGKTKRDCVARFMSCARR